MNLTGRPIYWNSTWNLICIFHNATSSLAGLHLHKDSARHQWIQRRRMRFKLANTFLVSMFFS